MILAIVLFVVGVLLSAFFSGTETGLYRVSRTRLVLDGLSGSYLAKSLIWLINRPTVFVATTLVGNNVANYVVSFSIVLGAAALFGSGGASELLAPILLTPIVFVFGGIDAQELFLRRALSFAMCRTPDAFDRNDIVLADLSCAWIIGTVVELANG